MRSWILISLLSGIGAVMECDLTNRKADLPFPDLETEGIESYQMSVEYTANGATQTDFYTEYYDILYGRGRVDSHQAGTSFSYVYKTASLEAWEITNKGYDDTCKLQNITDTPKLYRDDMMQWTYRPADRPDKWTIGPSAMFKIAFNHWNSSDANRKDMAYMGTFPSKIRGLDAQFWRRCDTDRSYVDYFFTADKDENAFGMKDLKRLPLRVVFGGVREGKAKEMARQQYDIISFQPYISLDLRPFQLPSGLGCERGYLRDAPEIPDFEGKNLEFHAEVIYRTINKDGEDTKFWSYYSTLFLSLDISSNNVAYYYTPWKSGNKDKDPEVEAPSHIVYDAKHGFMYKTSLSTGKCEISRKKNFFPEYNIPDDGGSIALTDPSILYPNSEFTYIGEGMNRGLKVNVFEEVVDNYVLNRNGTFTQIPKAIVTHSYYQDDVVERDTVSVKNSLAQVKLRFSGRKNMVEILTFNFFGFTTDLKNERYIYNIQNCFKNDDDYAWVTLGFNSDKDKIKKVLNDVPSVISNIQNAMYLRSELTPSRVPFIMVDVRDGIYVSFLILGRPPVMLDYSEPEEGQTVADVAEVEGVEDFDTCGLKCLESEPNCWGFSMCGAVCFFGTDKSTKTTAKKGCKLYKRLDMDSYVPSKEKMVQNLRTQVEQHSGFNLMLKDKDDNMIQIDASSIDVTYPGEDDKIFARIGNILDPRMRVVKAGYKLKDGTGKLVTNMGKLRYDECQRLCLDFKDCESASYCLRDSECRFISKFGDDLNKDEIQEDNMCNLITRKYADNFEQSPGLVLVTTAEEVLPLDTVEKCARACITQTKYKCLSFDHCPVDSSCSLHTVHYPNANTVEKNAKRSANCGHYVRRFSTEFKKNPERQTVGVKIPPLNNLTLEECSKSCMEYGKGTCFGFDFCQGDTMLSTTCSLLDSDPSQMKSTYKATCTNYLRTEAQFTPRPYSNSYAGGIGFLCFLIGGLVGVGIVFGIAYLRVNRR